ncbi:MAG: phosphate regulon sensor histidine kinase PhoR [Betaproteobacteria bacterium]
MPAAIASALIHCFIAAALGLAVGLVADPWMGWAMFALGLAVQLVFHVRHVVLLERWLQAPSVDNELEGGGDWETMFANLYRHERGRLAEVEDAQHDNRMLIAALQALADGLISLDEQGRIEWCNASAEDMLGLDRRADQGQPIANLIRHPGFLSYLRKGSETDPLSLRSHDGERALSLHVVPYGGDRRLIQVRDVTQSERIESMRRDFVANVSHELRTPLTVLSGFVETLRDLELETEERNRYFALMADQSERMRRILDELLVLSNLESAPPPPATDRVDMGRLCEKLLHDARALSAGRHEIRLETDGSGDLLGSEEELTSAFTNLVSNAIRYTPAGGSVVLQWHIGKSGAEFAVADTGLGIESQHIPRLTERFYRVDRSRSRETGGTGLGLAIVKHALSRHQATLDIQSTPGKGSRFAARFPLARVPA